MVKEHLSESRYGCYQRHELGTKLESAGPLRRLPSAKSQFHYLHQQVISLGIAHALCSWRLDHDIGTCISNQSVLIGLFALAPD